MTDYLVHNGSRHVGNRTLRALQPEHGGHKQYVCGNSFRLLRGRAVALTEPQLQEHLVELREKAARGLVYLTAADGSPVDIDTLEVRAPVPASPLPNPPLDSAANDKNAGHKMGSIRGEPAPPRTFVMPVAAPMAALENNPVAPVVEVPEEVLEVAPVAVDEPVAEPQVAVEETVVEAPVVKPSYQQYGGKRRGGR